MVSLKYIFIYIYIKIAASGLLHSSSVRVRGAAKPQRRRSLNVKVCRELEQAKKIKWKKNSVRVGEIINELEIHSIKEAVTGV